ncbi:uncharacterized protein LOC116073869 [Mastomys coucha]|uniref:uncharacterized protein LOC116073869 n=1 Tax=Mastomys coucha TaxID=35658 RepID=UPI00126211E1|nr:uncharacterized protein LOC116073869 [Mastomys coucha]
MQAYSGAGPSALRPVARLLTGFHGAGVPRASARRPPGAGNPTQRAAPERPGAARPGQPSTPSGGSDGEGGSVTYRTRVGSWRRWGAAPAPGTRLTGGCASRVLYIFAAAAATCQRERRKRRRRRRRRQRQASLAGLTGNSREIRSSGPPSSGPRAGGGRQPEREREREDASLGHSWGSDGNLGGPETLPVRVLGTLYRPMPLNL